MTRRQVIQVYLTMSLTKRLWMVILPAVILGTAAFLLTSSLRISLPVTLLTALCATAGILWSSYHRHLDDFPTDRRNDLDEPFIFED
ncbi:hypothetical protein Q0M94_17620 (plasmid) [Deinococcus radiomollis]|uniref:hypothetical protein n=1 Tax=Deinococcus radiomollis TaxID=468916 RepID=UPI003891B1E7